MQRVQMTLEEHLLAAVDRVAKRLGTTRSSFTREALRDALRKWKIREQERRHREGYRRHPVRPGELDIPEADQAWGRW